MDSSQTGKESTTTIHNGNDCWSAKFSADTSRGFNDPNGKYPLYVDESDVNKLARGTPTITIDSDGTIRPPEASYKAEYPYNHVTETESGHVIEVDDTLVQNVFMFS